MILLVGSYRSPWEMFNITDTNTLLCREFWTSKTKNHEFFDTGHLLPYKPFAGDEHWVLRLALQWHFHKATYMYRMNSSITVFCFRMKRFWFYKDNYDGWGSLFLINCLLCRYTRHTNYDTWDWYLILTLLYLSSAASFCSLILAWAFLWVSINFSNCCNWLSYSDFTYKHTK